MRSVLAMLVLAVLICGGLAGCSGNKGTEAGKVKVDSIPTQPHVEVPPPKGF